MQKARLMKLLLEIARDNQIKGTRLDDHPCVVAAKALDRCFDDINFLLKIARGNTDFYPLAMKLPAVKLLTLNTVNFAIIHNLGNKSNFLARIKSEHPSFNPDVVIYGHTHIKHYEKAYGVHFVNPGCAGNSRCAGQKTGAIIEWKNKDDIRVEFIGLS